VTTKPPAGQPPAEIGGRRYGARYGQALDWTADLHRGHVRKGTDVPYVAHLLAVSALVWRYGGDEDGAIAGLLHDAVEDCGGEPVLEQIHDRFGPEVAMIVAAATDSVEAEPANKAPWRERKEAHIAEATQLASRAEAGDADARRAVLVIACDKLENLRDLVVDLDEVGPSVWGRFNAGPVDQIWYHQQMAAALEPGLDTRIAAALHQAVARLTALVDAPGTGTEPGASDPA